MIIVIDTETTHYKPQLAHVIEIGAITDDGRTFECLCNPGIDLRTCQDALRINGIKEEEVLAAPPITVVASQFEEWLECLMDDNEVVFAGFNSDNYDGPILARKPWNISMDHWKYDVMKMAIDPMDEAGILPHHPYYGTPKWPKLTEAEKFFGITRQGAAHRALSDARTTLEILFKIFQKRSHEKLGGSSTENDDVHQREVI